MVPQTLDGVCEKTSLLARGAREPPSPIINCINRLPNNNLHRRRGSLLVFNRFLDPVWNRVQQQLSTLHILDNALCSIHYRDFPRLGLRGWQSNLTLFSNSVTGSSFPMLNHSSASSHCTKSSIAFPVASHRRPLCPHHLLLVDSTVRWAMFRDG